VNISLTRQIKLLEVLLTGTMQRLGPLVCDRSMCG